MKLLLSLVAAASLFAQTDDRIWTGVYSTAQAERGKAAFAKSCSNCHNANLDGSARAPALRGERFMGNWVNTSVNTLFVKLRDTMPATYPDTVADDVKLDILTYLLQANGFPTGAAELKLDPKDLENIRIVKKGAREVPNFALVEVVGCLEPGWTLTKASDPVVTKEETTKEETTKEETTKEETTKDEITTAPETKPLGTQSYLLVSVTAFHPADHVGQKMEARGLLYREPQENRLNLTSLRMLAPTCHE